ncbi:MAG: DNA/RNA nuclease SfsA [candidate division KSB1 bacterium]|nr:DNA/RNA nuclease SfsA [candidate division KSB1 bacterium]
MDFSTPLLPGTLIQRYKRFLADIRLDSGEVITAHCPNSGSMLGCNIPGAPVRVSRASNPKRKLPFTWELIRVGSTWVGVNTMRTNRIVEEALRERRIAPLSQYDVLKREFRYGANSRADFLLEDDGHKVFIEVKNVTLVEQGIALFPDAVTERGTKHLRELMQMVQQGHRGVIFFLVHREDAHSFAPAHHIDVTYGRTLIEAVEKGVELLVYDTTVNETGVRLRRELPWRLDQERISQSAAG